MLDVDVYVVLPRKSFLRRKSVGKTIETQMIAANIDVAFIVPSCLYDFNVSRLEHYLVMVWTMSESLWNLAKNTACLDPQELERPR